MKNKRKFIFTEEQVNEFVRRQLAENTYYVQDGQGQSTQQIADKAKRENPGASSDDTVVVPTETVSGGKNVQVGDGTTMNIPVKESVYTKKQLQEARLRSLKANSVAVKKKDLFKK